MVASWQNGAVSPGSGRYERQPTVILINGLAEQTESWYPNRWFWQRHFDVHTPHFLVYDAPRLHDRIAADLPIDVPFLVGLLEQYLDSFIQSPPYHLIAASLGAKIAVEYTRGHPEQVRSLVLLGPSGLGPNEKLPRVVNVRRSEVSSLLASVFYDASKVDPRLLAYYQRQMANRRWRLGLVKTLRGTMSHCVRDHLPHLHCPTLLITGEEDRIVPPESAATAACLIPQVRHLCFPACGHAPHLEKPWTVNRLVLEHLAGGITDPQQVSACGAA